MGRSWEKARAHVRWVFLLCIVSSFLAVAFPSSTCIPFFFHPHRSHRIPLLTLVNQTPLASPRPSDPADVYFHPTGTDTCAKPCLSHLNWFWCHFDEDYVRGRDGGCVEGSGFGNGVGIYEVWWWRDNGALVSLAHVFLAHN